MGNGGYLVVLGKLVMPKREVYVPFRDFKANYGRADTYNFRSVTVFPNCNRWAIGYRNGGEVFFPESHEEIDSFLRVRAMVAECSLLRLESQPDPEERRVQLRRDKCLAQLLDFVDGETRFARMLIHQLNAYYHVKKSYSTKRCPSPQKIWEKIDFDVILARALKRSRAMPYVH